MINNSFGRNKELIAILKIFKSGSDDQLIIGLDGEWGAGKTYIVKQLLCIWNLDKNNENDLKRIIDIDLIKSFKDSYIPFYYNAWENDYCNNPTESIIITLDEYIKEDKNIREKAFSSLRNTIKIKELVKEKSNNLIDIDNIDTSKRIQKYANTANLAKKTNQAIADVVNEALGDLDKRFLFIIDDLDRCNPEYAVKTLEAIKHNFNNEKITFLIATNTNELSNIIKGYYGGYIDGGKYLDRIFDLKLSLSEISIDDYLRNRLKTENRSIPILVAKHLSMTMRELNRYAESINICDNCISFTHRTKESGQELFKKFILIPLFIGYRISNPNIYQLLKNHKGLKYILEFTESFHDELNGYINANNNSDSTVLENLFSQYYDELFKKDRYGQLENTNDFWDIIDLVSPRIIIE